MKYQIRCFVLLAFAIFATSLTATICSAAETVESIRREYAAIRDAKNTLHPVSKDIFGQSAEGATAIAYMDHSKQVRLIEVTYYGESGRATYEFYFRSSQLLFVLEQQFTYNAPIYWTPEKAAAASKEEGIEYTPFDERATKLVEHRYYFNGPTLIRHLGPLITPDGSKWSDSDQSKRVRDTAAELLREF